MLVKELINLLNKPEYLDKEVMYTVGNATELIAIYHGNLPVVDVDILFEDCVYITIGKIEE